jgi:hypothetical protein
MRSHLSSSLLSIEFAALGGRPTGRADARREQRSAASRPGTFGNKISIAGLAHFTATSTTLTITSKKAIKR